MTRVKKTSDYIKELCLSDTVEKQTLGDLLKAQYAKWTETLDLRHFLAFTETIQKNKTEIGVAQYFGKFRAYAFEEYLHRLLQTEVQIPQPFQPFWGEKCLVWKKGGKEYAMEFDVSIGKRTDQFIEPAMVFETKVELDSARLKTALASFTILKRWNRKVKCFLVYISKEIDHTFLELAGYWMDAIFQFSLEKDEIPAFLKSVTECFCQR